MIVSWGWMGKLNRMDFSWSDRQREVPDAAGRFARQQLNYNIIENDRAGVFYHNAWKKCGGFGIQGVPVSKQYGENIRIRNPFCENQSVLNAQVALWSNQS